MTEYYDYVLGLIPLALFGLTGGLVQMSLTLTQSISIGSVVAAAIICHAMFVRAPVDSGGQMGRDGSQATRNVGMQNAD